LFNISAVKSYFYKKGKNMSYQINLNEEQFLSLLKSSFYAATCNAGDESCGDGGHKSSEAIDDTLDLLLEAAVEQKLVKNLETEEGQEESEVLEEFIGRDENLMNVFEHHKEDLFWTELVNHLVGRDLIAKYGDNYDAELVETQKLEEELYAQYEEEFKENGLKNFKL
jgi:hypothetical protein